MCLTFDVFSRDCEIECQGNKKHFDLVDLLLVCKGQYSRY